MRTRISRRCRPRAPSSRGFDSTPRHPRAVSPRLAWSTVRFTTKDTEDTKETKVLAWNRINQNPGAMTALDAKEISRQIAVYEDQRREWPSALPARERILITPPAIETSTTFGNHAATMTGTLP